MQIEFDSEKDRANRQKHGLSLAAAVEMDLLAAQVIPDDRHDYGEARFRAYGWIGGRLHMLAFTMRGEHAAGDLTEKGKPNGGKAIWRRN